MNKYIRVLSLLFLFILSFKNVKSQTVKVNDSLEIKFRKAKTITNAYFHTSVKMKKSKKVKRLLVRCEIKAQYKPVDINSFSLLDTVNKLRYRIAVYSGYKKGGDFLVPSDVGKPYLKKEILNKKGKQYKFLPKYDESVIDNFEKFKFEGYKTIETPMRYYNIVSGEVISVEYYSPSKKPKFVANMQFPVFIDLKTPILQLYYGKKLIKSIKLDI